MGYVGRSAGTWEDVGPNFGLGGSNVPIFTKRFTNLQYFTMNFISKWSPLFYIRQGALLMLDKKSHPINSTLKKNCKAPCLLAY